MYKCDWRSVDLTANTWVTTYDNDFVMTADPQLMGQSRLRPVEDQAIMLNQHGLSLLLSLPDTVHHITVHNGSQEAKSTKPVDHISSTPSLHFPRLSAIIPLSR